MRVTKETKNEKRAHLEPELSEKERSERENRNVGTEEIGKRGRWKWWQEGFIFQQGLSVFELGEVYIQK